MVLFVHTSKDAAPEVSWILVFRPFDEKKMIILIMTGDPEGSE